jgi:acetolactate synthase-1/2/3 large subunit
VSPDFAKLAESYGLKGIRVDKRADVIPTVNAARTHKGTVVIDFMVEQEDSVFPMVPAGNDLHNMIRRPSPSPIVETGADV